MCFIFIIGYIYFRKFFTNIIDGYLIFLITTKHDTILLLLLALRKNSGSHLYTCAIRPAAIYGPGEERHLPRILSLAKMGLLFFKVGDPSVKTDWVHVDNLVLALILASMGLLDDIPGREGHPVAAGQPYFICDGKITINFYLYYLWNPLQYFFLVYVHLFSLICFIYM